MVQRGQYARLAFKARLPVLIGEPEIGHDLERDVPTERRVAGPIDAPHAAGAEKSRDLVRPEAFAREQRLTLAIEYVCDRLNNVAP